jgi:DNA-binding protein HU-beta
MKKTKSSTLIKELSEKYDQRTYVVNFWIDVITEAIVERLKKGEALALLDFGTFTLKKKRAMIRRNPQTQENFLDKEHFVPFLKFSKSIKTEIKKKFTNIEN